MKKLTTEQKAKAYDKAIERANELNYVSDKDSLQRKTVEHIFPELAESEGEKIKKELLENLRELLEMYNTLQTTKEYSKVQSWIDWVEKKGDKISTIEGFESEFERQVSCLIASAINKEHEYNQGYVKWTANALLNYAKHELEKQGGQKTAENTGPKFKAGDWIVFNGLTLYIKEVVKGYYRTKSIGGISNSYDWSIDNAARLWTIEDAKDGDVLVHNGYTFIFMGIKDGIVQAIEEHFLELIPFGEPDKYNIYCPATKEQHDLLFQKMKESGYEWDAEKKELKKIKQNPWSEEDELHIRELESLVKRVWAIAEHENDKETIHKMSDLLFFLKTLKPQPKQDSTDRFFEGFKKGEQSVIENYGKYGLCKPSDKVEPKWKPTDKDIFELQCVINNDPYNGFILKALLEQLKKLKGK